MAFQLHPRLQQDSIEIGQFSLSQLLLINDSQYPWLVLVPKRENISEVYQLSEDDQVLLQQESYLLAKKLASLYFTPFTIIFFWEWCVFSITPLHPLKCSNPPKYQITKASLSASHWPDEISRCCFC